jgi:hypothetical protein
MKRVFVFLSIGSIGFLPANHHTEFIDPTGTYILKGPVKNSRITGNSGEIRIKLLDSGRAAVCMCVNKGYPGYESASFMDTLVYNDNMIKYNPPSDPQCIVVISFAHRLAEITQVFSDPQGCVFARGILVSSVFEKLSEETPVIQDLSSHGATH